MLLFLLFFFKLPPFHDVTVVCCLTFVGFSYLTLFVVSSSSLSSLMRNCAFFFGFVSPPVFSFLVLFTAIPK